MGKQGKLSEDEALFAKARFFRHYSSVKPEGPPRVARREWGFFLFGGDRMHRPVVFRNREDMRDYLFRKVPRHAYYSTAYYRKPDMPMESPEKGWMGADLIFDLDADGLPGAEKLSYEEQLEAVKVEITRLYDIFLQEHLGFSDKEMELVFSGGRGYHIHIRSPSVLDMDSDERREIMDYVAGTFQDFSEVLVRRRVILGNKVKEEYLLPTGGGGWRGIVHRSAERMIMEFQLLGEESSVEMMHRSGVRRDVASRMYRRLFDRDRYRAVLERGDLSVFSTDGERKAFLRVLEAYMRDNYAVHPDVHVTPDIRRLIRLPYSLHGGTGFLVMPVGRDELDDFTPTRDAVPDIYGDEKVEVHLDSPVKISIGAVGERLKGSAQVSEAIAMFLILSGRGSLHKALKEDAE